MALRFHGEKRNLTRSQSFVTPVASRSLQKIKRTMSSHDSSDKNAFSMKYITKLDDKLKKRTVQHNFVDSKSSPSSDQLDNNYDRRIHHSRSCGGSVQLSDCNQYRNRQLMPIVSSSEPTTVDVKTSTSFSAGFTVGDNSLELLAKPSNGDTSIRSASVTGVSRKFPLTDYLPHLSKSRCNRFHKLFKRVPEDEDPVDYYSCAFKGDILLHGFLYVSPNWVCFYSKIKGRGRLLEINMEKVISITREKMALFIPNAIGIQTADKKYVFGSFMSRDTTFRLLVSLWRMSQDSPDSIESSISSVSESVYFETVTKVIEKGNRAMIIDHTLTVPSTTDDSSDDSDSSSMCLQCGPIDMGDRGDTVTDRSRIKFAESKIISHKVIEEPRPYFYLIHCLDFRKICRAFFHFALKLQKMPRTSLLLAVCSILVFFLLISAVCMAYKILLIQAKLELSSVWTQGASYNEFVKGMIYTHEAGTHASVLNHLHSVLKSNIQLLEQIQSSLQSLYSKSVLNTCSKVECS